MSEAAMERPLTVSGPPRAPASAYLNDARAAEPGRPVDKPNIILAMADDMGWGDTGYNGHPVLRTPSLDDMARSGIRFDRFYAGAPVCSPTRGSVLTGRHPYRYGIFRANVGHLRKEEICLAELMSENGYAAGHFGKWHLGALAPDYSGKGEKRNPEENYMTPGMSGFGEWFSTEYAVATWDPYNPARADSEREKTRDPRALYWHNGRNIVDGMAEGLAGCDSRIIMDKAIPFIEHAVAEGKPFFAAIWFHAPHAPVIGGPQYMQKYPGSTANEQHYYAVVAALDEQMGRLRKKLRDLGVAGNTMLWFCSDNGPEGNPEKRDRHQGSAGPFRGRKRSLYEGGVRVPGILEWPARVKTPRVVDIPCVTSDYFTTVLDILGYTLKGKPRPYDGVSLLPLIEGAMPERPRPIGFQTGDQATLNDNRHKLVHNYKAERLRSDNGKTPVAEWELYDLVGDPAETNNLAAEHPEVVARMKTTLDEWKASCKASLEGADYNNTSASD